MQSLDISPHSRLGSAKRLFSHPHIEQYVTPFFARQLRIVYMEYSSFEKLAIDASTCPWLERLFLQVQLSMETKEMTRIWLKTNQKVQEMRNLKEWALFDSSGSTVLIRAILEKSTIAVQKLLKSGFDVRQKDRNGRTPLCWAAEHSSASMIILLLGELLKNSEYTHDYNTLVNISDSKNHIQVDVNFLIENGVYLKSRLLDESNPNVSRLLKSYEQVVQAVKERKQEKLEQLLSNGLCRNFIYFGDDLFMLAVGSNNFQMVESMIEKGADPNSVNIYGQSAITKAAGSGFYETCQVLIEKGAELNDSRRLPLMVATINGHLDILKLLISWNADVNAIDSNGKTALMYASESNKLEIAEILVKNGAFTNFSDHIGMNALLLASRHGHVGIVKLLVENNTLVNCVDRQGRTALMHAAIAGHVDTCSYLTLVKADSKMIDLAGKTAQMHADLYGHSSIVEILSH